MKKYFFILLLLVNCTSNQYKNEKDFSKIKFSKDLSFNEFKNRLEEYANNSPYPDINN